MTRAGWELATLVQWMADNSMAADYCATYDVHLASIDRTAYSVFVVVGHDEYWSREMRQNVDSFVRDGGNFVVLGGNTCYYQVRFQDNGRTMICYKDYWNYAGTAGDPQKSSKYRSTKWKDLDPAYEDTRQFVAYPETLTTGLASEPISYVVNSSDPVTSQRGAIWGGSSGARPYTTGLRVYRPEHWALEGANNGSNFTAGQIFGGSVFGYETDTITCTLDQTTQTMLPTGADLPSGGGLLPDQIRILAYGDVRADPYWTSAPEKILGEAALVSVSNGGTIFNTGVVSWITGTRPDVANDPSNQKPSGWSPSIESGAISRITKNVLTTLRDADAIYEYYASVPNGTKLYLDTTKTLTNVGWYYYMAAFLAYKAQAPGTVPVWRYSRDAGPGGYGTYFMYSLSPSEVGWTRDANPAFYAFATSASGKFAPVYAHYQNHPNAVSFFYTRLSSVSGWYVGGVAFYVPG